MLSVAWASFGFSGRLAGVSAFSCPGSGVATVQTWMEWFSLEERRYTGIAA